MEHGSGKGTAAPHLSMADIEAHVLKMSAAMLLCAARHATDQYRIGKGSLGKVMRCEYIISTPASQVTLMEHRQELGWGLAWGQQG